MSFDLTVTIKPLDFPIDVRNAADAYTSNGFIISAGASLAMSNPGNNGFDGLESGDPQFVVAEQALGTRNIIYLGTCDFTGSDKRYVHVFLGSENSGASTKDVGFTGAGTLSSLTVEGTPSGYSLAQEGNLLRITSTGAWGNLPIVTATASSASIDSITISSVSGTSNAFGIQAVTASEAPPAPPNCLKGSTQVVVSEDNESRPIHSLKSGDKVMVHKPDGSRCLEPVQVYRAPGAVGEVVWVLKEGEGLMASTPHLFLIPAGERCESCGHGVSKAIEYSCHSCRLSKSFHLDGYATVRAKTLGSRLHIQRKEPWYHLVLPEPSWAFEITPTLLSEGLRHTVGTAASDFLWTQI